MQCDESWDSMLMECAVSSAPVCLRRPHVIVHVVARVPTCKKIVEVLKRIPDRTWFAPLQAQGA